jgi:hypothetical protein
MPDNDVPPCEVFTELMDGVQQSLVVGNKDLDVIAKLGQLSRRTDKIWNGTRCPVPNENLKSFSAQIRSYPAADDPKADHSNLLVL